LWLLAAADRHGANPYTPRSVTDQNAGKNQAARAARIISAWADPYL
jgi:hypothetical protein